MSGFTPYSIPCIRCNVVLLLPAQYDWVANMKSHTGEHPDDAIFATMHAQQHRHIADQVFGSWDNRVDFVVTHDLFATHTVLVPRGNRFLFTERYISVAQVSQWSPSVKPPHHLVCAPPFSPSLQVIEPKARSPVVASHVVLQLSSDGGHRFHPAELEYPIVQHSYTILDTAHDSVFLHVNHNGKE
jgi:hypothetical protein